MMNCLGHGETKRFFCIHFGEYIVLRIYTFSQIYILSPPFKNGVFGLDFLALSKQRAGRQVEQALSLDCDACLPALCVC